MYSVIAAVLILAGSAATPAPQKAKKFVLSADKRVYDVGINFAYQTTIWLPVDCAHPAIGDPEYFGVFYNKKKTRQRRFIVTALVEKLGATTNVTLSCDQGVRLVLDVTQVPPEQAALSVEFEFDETETARVRTAIDNERDRCRQEKEGALAEARLVFQEDAERLLAEGLIERLIYGDELTATKQNFVNVKSRNAVLIGNRGFVLFEVQPRDNAPVTVMRVDVLEADTDAPLPEVRLVMPEPKVAVGRTSKGVAVFSNPSAIRELTLVVHLDGADPIRLEGIEL